MHGTPIVPASSATTHTINLPQDRPDYVTRMLASIGFHKLSTLFCLLSNLYLGNSDEAIWNNRNLV
jgi:hypothetical protein